MLSIIVILSVVFLLLCWVPLRLHIYVNVCREKGSLLSFVYKFGQVARLCC